MVKNRLDEYVNDDLGYLNDHIAGSSAAIQLVERCQAREGDTELGHVLRALRGEIEEDRVVLERVILALGGSTNPVKRASALGVELLANLRMSLPVLGAGSVEATKLEELEALSLGIEGKRLLWQALGAIGSDPRLDDFDFAALERRAQGQRERLERFHTQLASAVFRD